MWLSTEILEKWNVQQETSSSLDGEMCERAYAIWSHAEKILKSGGNDLHLVDVITNLKRAVDHRLRLLDSVYEFIAIPIREKPKHTVELLHYLGLIRPMMLERLITLRNAVEHEDYPAPDIEQCAVFVEFVWYLLRSTDRLVRQPVGSVMLTPLHSEEPHPPYFVTLDVGPDSSWEPKLYGWVPPALLSQEPKDGWAQLKVEKVERREEIIERVSSSDPFP